MPRQPNANKTEAQRELESCFAGLGKTLRELILEMRPQFEAWGIKVDPDRPLAGVSSDRLKKVSSFYGVGTARDLSERLKLDGCSPSISTLCGWRERPGRMDAGKTAAMVNALGYARSCITARDIRVEFGLDKPKHGRLSREEKRKMTPWLFEFDKVSGKITLTQMLMPDDRLAEANLGSARADAERAATWALMTFLKPDAISRIYQTALDASLSEQSSELVAHPDDYSGKVPLPLDPGLIETVMGGSVPPTAKLGNYRWMCAKAEEYVKGIGMATGFNAVLALDNYRLQSAASGKKKRI